MEVGEREIIYLPLHCHHHNDHFKCFIIVRDKVTRQCPQTTILSKHGA